MKASPTPPFIALIALCASLPALADAGFHVRPLTRDDVPPGRGQCDIRLQIDGEAEVSLQRDFVRIRDGSGRAPLDDGSLCNAPLPERPLEGFRFAVKAGRGQVRLLAEPARRNEFTAVVRIHDPAGRYGRYHFRLSWDMAASEDRAAPAAGAFAWNNVLHYSSRGRGVSTLAGAAPQPLLDATVDIDRGGRVRAAFRTPNGRPLVFTGSVMGRDREILKVDVMADAPTPRVRGTLHISTDARDRIDRITLDATDGRDRLHLDWDRR